jgi:hypothetical protein
MQLRGPRGKAKVTETERTYDLLDILRVIKGVWRWALAISLLAAIVAGAWAYFRSQDVSLPVRSEAVLRFPAEAFAAGEIEKELRPRGATRPGDGKTFEVSVTELTDQFSAPYRTVNVTFDTIRGVDGEGLLEAAIGRLADGVQSFDASTLGVDVQTGQVSDETVARAAAAASIVSTLNDLEMQMQKLQTRGSGPLDIVEPVETYLLTDNLRWVRFPVVAGIAGLLAVLFVAFTLDGIRIATASRRGRA